MSVSNQESRAVADESDIHISRTELWQQACESFIAGVFHSIASRVSALSGIATMAGMGKDLDGTLLSLLEDEVELLTDILDASRILPRVSEPTAGPCQLTTLVPLLLRLVETNLDARGVELEYEGVEEGADVEIDRTTAAHSIASLLICLCWRARRSGATRMRTELRADGPDVEFSAELCEFSGEPSLDDHGSLPAAGVLEDGLRSIAETAARHGGALELDDKAQPSRFTYRLPKLRRR